jgi:hypothetical protein
MNNTIGRKYSFEELLRENNYKITIPIIQRDYVQGKSNKSEIRIEFLLTLKRYLTEGQNKDLDFVYGFKKEDNFIPLDGQQRLTTLFLLHTYLAVISNNTEHWKSIIFDGENVKFNYEVRRSSSEFCNCLIKYGIDFIKFNHQSSEEKDFQKFVQNLSWYKLSWDYDPTIASMLTMLEEINIIFQDSPQFYDQLVSKEKPVLTFLFLNLEHLTQGDDLYIKMNARGKTLTPFENFKARFEEKIGTLFQEEDEIRKILYKGEEINYGTKDYFSFKIDTVWSNLFWVYRSLIGDKNTYDDELFSFIKEILIYHYVETIDEANNEIDLILNESFQSFNQLNSYPLITKKSINFLIDVLDIIKYDNNGITTYCTNKYFNEKDVFASLLEGKIQNPNRVKFFAYIKYLLQNKGNAEGIQSWMRVVCNLVENKIMNSQEMILPAFKSIVNLLPYSNDILSYLTTENKIIFFDADQIIEERIKANILVNTPGFIEDLFEAEQSAFHAGQIGYLLEVSEILQNVDMSTYSIKDKTIIDKNIADFKSYSFKAISLFEQLNNNSECVFERAVLTYGNYLIKKGNQYNFSSSKKVSNYDRDYSWKKMLKLDYADLYSVDWFEKRKIFYEIFKDNTFDFSETLKSLKKKIKNFSDKDWRYEFVKDPSFIEYCKQGFIYTDDNFGTIQLLNASQMNHLRMDFHVYKFWLSLEIDNYKKFKCNCNPVKGSSEDPYIEFGEFIYLRKNYAVQFYNGGNNDFFVRFYKVKGYNKIVDYDRKLAETVKAVGLKWEDTTFHSGFFYAAKNYKTATTKFLELIDNLDNL